MKKYPLLISIALLGLAAISARANTTVTLDAGQLTSPAAAPMQADDSAPSTNGSLVLLIDLGSSNTLDNALAPGAYVSGTNTVLAAGGFNTNGGTNETLTIFAIVGASNAGDQIALRWFPQITYAEYQAGAVPAVGDYFGSYNPGGGNPDGGNPWTVPSGGSQISLNFYTSNSDGGGTQPPTAGYAGYQVAMGVNFSAWESSYFTTVQLSDPTISGASATPENDGVPNLLKYLYNINPTVPMTTAERGTLPTLTSTPNGNGNDLTFTYEQSPTVTGITITAQTSTDLQNWTAVTSQQIGTDMTTGDDIMQAQVTATGNKQFIRLNVTMP